MPVTYPELDLIPDQAGYNVAEGNPNIAIQLDGGSARMRADKLGAVHLVNVQWTLGPENYAYLKAFIRTTLAHASLPFQIALIIDGAEPTIYPAQFVPNSIALKTQVGLTYVVAAQLWVVPVDPDGDAAILAAGPFA